MLGTEGLCKNYMSKEPNQSLVYHILNYVATDYCKMDSSWIQVFRLAKRRKRRPKWKPVAIAVYTVHTCAVIGPAFLDIEYRPLFATPTIRVTGVIDSNTSLVWTCRRPPDCPP